MLHKVEIYLDHRKMVLLTPEVVLCSNHDLIMKYRQLFYKASSYFFVLPNVTKKMYSLAESTRKIYRN